MPLHPPAELLVPHTPPARLLEEVVDWEGATLVATGRVPGDSPLARGGSVPSFVALELAAQATSALRRLGALARGEGGSPPLGYLVGVKEARFKKGTLGIGTELRAEVRLLTSAARLAVYAVTVYESGLECASAILSIVVADREGEGGRR